MAKLTALKARKVKHSRRTMYGESHGDEHGLVLLVQPTGAKSWVQRVTLRGKRIAMGLGGFPVVTLAEAREAALENRRMARKGVDPRNKARSTAPTFRTLAEAVIQRNARTWRDGVDSNTAKQWRTSLKTYADGKIGSMAVDAIETADVLRVLEPIWVEKHPTANQLRQRISVVMQRAIAEGHRKDDPAGKAIEQALAKVKHCTEHHDAIHYSQVGEAVRKMRGTKARAATKLMFEFLVLTAARGGEAAGATWDEVDLEAATWTVPAERMKAGREHRVPLSPRCVAILREAQALPRTKSKAKSPLIFPTPASNKNLKGLGYDATLHGFRSSFRDWVAEQTDAPREVAEAALAHVVKNAVEAAYARSDLFEKRRELMEKWAAFVAEGNPA